MGTKSKMARFARKFIPKGWEEVGEFGVVHHGDKLWYRNSGTFKYANLQHVGFPTGGQWFAIRKKPEDSKSVLRKVIKAGIRKKT